VLVAHYSSVLGLCSLGHLSSTAIVTSYRDLGITVTSDLSPSPHTH